MVRAFFSELDMGEIEIGHRDPSKPFWGNSSNRPFSLSRYHPKPSITKNNDSPEAGHDGDPRGRVTLLERTLVRDLRRIVARALGRPRARALGRYATKGLGRSAMRVPGRSTVGALVENAGRVPTASAAGVLARTAMTVGG